MAIFWWGNAILHISFSGLRGQDIISSSLVSTHVIRMRLFNIFVKMGVDFCPLWLIYGHFGTKNGPKMAQNGRFCRFCFMILLGLCEPSKTWLSKSSLLRKRLSYNILGPSKPYRTGPLKKKTFFFKFCQKDIFSETSGANITFNLESILMKK